MRTTFVSWTALCLERREVTGVLQNGSRSKGIDKEDLFSTTSNLSWSRCAHPQSGEKTANQATSIRKVIFTGVNKAHVIDESFWSARN